MRVKTVLLAALAAMSLTVGAWLLVSPSINRQSDLDT